ncbi:winged helix-turn-helix domain-containing protein [Microbacterium hatanonis]|uniref:Restriction system protein Mrr-like N-terminal domain-containing protein n=1 Tax=Microbacterium hatanonis TaxID=404366 RepID=A0A5C8I355_9MICO|nr:winged helix-turn-helix domain-containing protein [Microbacterium hatanonis]TXK12365.1 hypothetical protein FVP77_02480 [Microbacterium hatanonis]
MAFPHDDLIADELLKLLADQPDGRAHGPDTYEPLAKRFPELTEEDLASRVPTGERRWDSKVRFARLKLVNRGLVYPAKEGPSPQRGVWILTDPGMAVARGEAIENPTPADLSTGAEGIILGWNRSLWDGWDETYEGAINMVMAGATYETRWSVGSRVDVASGTDAWLLRQGGPYGIVGHGVVTSEPFEGEHFAKPGQTSRYVDVAFDVLLDEVDILSRDILEQAVPEVAWRYQFQSGNRIPAEINSQLVQLWNNHIS